MLHAIHPLGKHAQAVHEKAMQDKAEQEEEKQGQDDTRFGCLVFGLPILIVGVLMYTYGG